MELPRRAVLWGTASLAFAPPIRAAENEKPPPARVSPVTDDVFGTKVTDPYRWMEAPGNPAFVAYLKAQGDYARHVLDRLPGREALARSIAFYTGGLTYVRSVQVFGGKLFIEERPPGANSFILSVRDVAGGAPRVLVDPDAAHDGKKRAMNWWQPSPDGKLVVFGLSESGSEDTQAHIVETSTGGLLPDRIDRTQYAGPSWAEDGRSFVFNRLAGTDKASVDYYKHSVAWRHVVGSDPAADTRALAADEFANVPVQDTEFPYVMFTPNAAMALGVLQNGVQTEVTLVSARAQSVGGKDALWSPICTPKDKITGYTQRGDDLYLVSYDGAPRYKLLKTSVSKPDVAHAAIVVPQSDVLLDAAFAARDGIYVTGRNGRGLAVLRRLNDNGTIDTIALPFEGSIDLFSNGAFTDPRADGMWFVLSSWTRPPVICHARADGHVQVLDVIPGPTYDLSAYRSETVLVSARDGAKVPLSILYKEGVKRDGSAPVLISAYGSYGLSVDPEFAPRSLPWMDLGGVFAVAHVRGGGELGRAWYEAGKKDTKPNTWRDLIDCAEYLARERWASPGKLAIQGTSAGGITVGRALTERPDLFAVVISRVGVSNAARSEFSPNGPPNIPEFGSVTDPKTAHALLAMDALYAVRDGVKYPSVMLTTGLTDPRVSPWEPGKMAARLQAASASGNPVLLRVEGEGGHGVGSTRDQTDREYADLYAFALWRMGDLRFLPKATK